MSMILAPDDCLFAWVAPKSPRMGRTMLSKDICLKAARKFRAKNGLDTADENLIATIHLMNVHGIDAHTALDQSSRGANDSGIDAWFYDDGSRRLIIYQSKLTEARSQTLRGLDDLDRARRWLENVIVRGAVENVPSDNPCLFNLYARLSAVRGDVKRVEFVLASLFDQNELEDTSEYRDFEREVSQSELIAFMRQYRNGTLAILATQYNLEPCVPGEPKVYQIDKIQDSRVILRKDAHLDLAYVTLFSLVELYRQRGDILFDKNVRLSLMETKKGRDRLVHPMERTLDEITSGKLSPNIFPFYHTGVTIAATASSTGDQSLNLKAPSIINGCQTIAIANEYLKKLIRQKNEAAIGIFRQIKVVAKVVIGTTTDELREITNANNRQNPIDDWQLFSNEPIHIEIEAALKDCGVFYERQKGKFASVLKNTDTAKHYYNTNGTFIQVTDLGQVIALAMQNLSWAAKAADIFVNKDNHDKIFNHGIPRFTRDIVFVSNLYKAMKRGLNTYLELPVHANSNAPVIFKKQILRAHVFYLALLHFYQNDNRRSARADFSTSLCKIANKRLVDELEAFYQKIVTKIKNWYTSESGDLSIDVGRKQMDAYFGGLAIELGIDVEGEIPFSATAIDWDEYRTD